MPRIYKPKPGGKRLKQYSLRNLELAIEDFMRNGGSQRQVAKRYGIPRGTLQNKILGRYPGKLGGQTVLTEKEEIKFIEYRTILGNWGYPLDYLDFRMIVKTYLDGIKRVEKFANNLPSNDWVRMFLKRHKDLLSIRHCQNIKLKRSQVSKETIIKYFDNLGEVVKDVPSQNILNYDETNLSDDPGKKKCIFRRGMKYPERILNSTKASTSLMFSVTANETLLPLYVVYKAKHIMNTWMEGGPPKCRYNRSLSGWFDTVCFNDWFTGVIVPWAQKLDGKKVVIGDNLSSHFSPEVLNKCAQHNISFVCLPPNSTHLCQPLDVAVFSSIKMLWRNILSKWKAGPGHNFATLPKDTFPKLLLQLVEENTNLKINVVSGFKKTGIFPTDRNQVLLRLPDESVGKSCDVFSRVFLQSLENLRYQTAQGTVARRKRVNVDPGKSISADDIQPEPAKKSKPSSSKPVEVSVSSSSESDTESEDLTETESDAESIALGQDNVNEDEIEAGKWVLIRYMVKNRSIYYIGKILEANCESEYDTDENSDPSYGNFWEVTLLRRSKKTTNAFVYPTIVDIDCVKSNSIVRVLPSPSISKRNHHIFSVKFDGLNVE